MDTRLYPTYFAPAYREPQQVVARQTAAFLELSPLLRVLLDAIPIAVMVLNDARQIVHANTALLAVLELPEEDVVGRRLGEALRCNHAGDVEGGCGCSEYCGACGAVRAMLASQAGRADVEECRIVRAGGEALDLRVWATPFPVGSERYTIFAAEDISHEKRRRALERTFFHDVLNTATGIRVTANLLREDSAARSMIPNLLDRLIEEIEVQRQLTAAESGELAVTPATVDVAGLLYEVAHLYGGDGGGLGPHVRVELPREPLRFVSDRTLLRRVIGNMLRNAVDASLPSDTVTVGCLGDAEGVEFSVHNSAYIPREFQLQLFQRSFSTKGSGRGLGTYSIRLLTERYLGGCVSFTSTPPGGTTFTVRYPLALG